LSIIVPMAAPIATPMATHIAIDVVEPFCMF
jgi:hypothetical protein